MKFAVLLLCVIFQFSVSTPTTHLERSKSFKESDQIHYIKDVADAAVPEVNAFEDNIIKSADKKEYILISDKAGKVIIIDAISYQEILNRDLPEIGLSITAIVDNVFYDIDPVKGEIYSTTIESIMDPEKAVFWVQVGLFPAETGWIRNSAAVNGSSIYFLTSSAILYSFDTTTKIISKRAQVGQFPVQWYGSLVIVDNILYIHTRYQLFSFDGTTLKTISTPDVREFCGLIKEGRTVCRVGGNTTNINPDPAYCYDPIADAWTTVSYINEHRRLSGVVATESATYVFGGEGYYPNGTTRNLNSAEIFNQEDRSWSIIPSSLTGGPRNVHALSFIL